MRFDNPVGVEIYDMIMDFFNEQPKGIVTLYYPNPLWEHINKDGVSFTKDTFMNTNRMQWKPNGILLRQTLGFRLVTGKHLYIPYSKIDKVLMEDE